MSSKTLLMPSPAFDDASWQCLVSAVYHEARGEPVKGKRAVLEVVMHRSAKSGKSVCEVVAQKQQFSFMRKRKLMEPKDFDIVEVIRAPATGLCATHYHNLTVQPAWAAKLTFVGKIGNHKFYREGSCAR